MSAQQSHHTDVAPSIPEWNTGDRLRKAREHAGLSSADMARRLGVHRNTIGNFENGHVDVARRTLLAWSLTTSVPVEWLETGHAPSISANAPTVTADDETAETPTGAGGRRPATGKTHSACSDERRATGRQNLPGEVAQLRRLQAVGCRETATNTSPVTGTNPVAPLAMAR